MIAVFDSVQALQVQVFPKIAVAVIAANTRKTATADVPCPRSAASSAAMAAVADPRAGGAAGLGLSGASGRPRNRFVLVPLTSVDKALELQLGVKVVAGRRSSPTLNSLHISREQVKFEMKLESTGKTLITMENVRVHSFARRAQLSPDAVTHNAPVLLPHRRLERIARAS